MNVADTCANPTPATCRRQGIFARVGRGLAAVACSLAASCAHVEERVSLRAQALEQPHTTRVEIGSGKGIEGERLEGSVRAQVQDLTICAAETRQRALGFRRVERRTVGQSLLIQWVFGGLFTATGTGLMLAQAQAPPAEEDTLNAARNERIGYLYAGGIAAVGLGLLAGSVWQQWGLGVHETPLGERVLQTRGDQFACARRPATGGRVRLTLPDGLQIEAEAGADGVALVPLPDDVEARLQAEGSRRASLEVMGDARAQVRIGL